MRGNSLVVCEDEVRLPICSAVESSMGDRIDDCRWDIRRFEGASYGPFRIGVSIASAIARILP